MCVPHYSHRCIHYSHYSLFRQFRHSATIIFSQIEQCTAQLRIYTKYLRQLSQGRIHRVTPLVREQRSSRCVNTRILLISQIEFLKFTKKIHSTHCTFVCVRKIQTSYIQCKPKKKLYYHSRMAATCDCYVINAVLRGRGLATCLIYLKYTGPRIVCTT